MKKTLYFSFSNGNRYQVMDLEIAQDYFDVFPNLKEAFDGMPDGMVRYNGPVEVEVNMNRLALLTEHYRDTVELTQTDIIIIR